AVIGERLHIPLGEPLDTHELDKNIGQIYALGFLNLVTYDVVEEDGKSGIVIHVTQDSRGTRFLAWGVDIFSGNTGTNATLRLAILNAALDDLGSEQRFLVQLGETPAVLWEVYKAINPALQLYLRPKAFWERQDLATFDGSGREINEYRVSQFGGQIDVLREFSRYAA